MFLDACGAYHAVRIEPGSRACKAFISLFGKFQYIRMPFGLAKAGSVYSRMLDVAMKDVEQGVLSQVQDGQKRFLGCWGRKCNKYERNYPSYKGELLAVIQCIKKWEHILSYRPFEVHTNASALKYLTTMKNQSHLFTRWYQELGGFNFTVIVTRRYDGLTCLQNNMVFSSVLPIVKRFI